MTQMPIGIKPIPSNVNLQKEKPVRMSFNLKGHGDHYGKRVIQWCRGWIIVVKHIDDKLLTRVTPLLLIMDFIHW
ncbi:hypothetical protein DAPPUDRAFT_329996 [Daphnia pulex]|uniref:Uncharacterized protein n=1 Tax=Daphnia pulex TaxID=6669 RepID=E9HI88_DAPPU|nr:hypothetical protein DAPPUDRAFT_329996 [Daphnia pulex]|eukprot:EFX68538.1 hypothetical protein DAPPUDRAFT_329996 [Daphnia pulex]